MPPADLLSLVLSWHSVAFPLTLVAVYRYSDRSDTFRKSLDGTDALLGSLRRFLVEDLRSALEPLFQDPPKLPTPLLGPDGSTYHETTLNPLHSEEYRQTLHDFMRAKSPALVAYSDVRWAKNRWCKWARLLSWAVLLLCVWEGAALVTLAILSKLVKLNLPNSILAASCAPTILGFIVIFVCFAALLLNHDVIMDKKRDHDPN